MQYKKEELTRSSHNMNWEICTALQTHQSKIGGKRLLNREMTDVLEDSSMQIPEKAKQEGLVDYADRLSGLYARTYDPLNRKQKGQFFTPKQVSVYMASLFEIHHNKIRLLDPGAGTGVLTAAFCERILSKGEVVDLTLDAYENDANLLPLLEKVLESCKLELEEKGNNVGYNICGQDFILHNEGYFRESDLFLRSENPISYDFVISNPPYYKLNKDSPQSRVTMKLIYGQPNIYMLFMALSANMIRSGGEIVFITPRSFCSGLYYKKFREFLLKNIQITDIHIFESRKDIFSRDEILQENIIIKGRKEGKMNENEKVIISTSKNRNLNKLKNFEVSENDIFYYKNGDVFIRIPTSLSDVEILRIVDSWPNTLKDLGLEISTGPVVPFRAKDYLLPELKENSKSAPLLWMHNIQGTGIVWPLRKNKKALAIHVSGKTMPLLLHVKNYVLVKRFTSKEQKRRLYAAVLLKSDFPYKRVGIENHVNYIHKPKGALSVYEAFGIAAILNTTVIDNYFRTLNGNTQVNSTDIRSLPFPQIKDIIKIGEIVYKSQSYENSLNLDIIVAEILGTNVKMEKTKKGVAKDE